MLAHNKYKRNKDYQTMLEELLKQNPSKSENELLATSGFEKLGRLKMLAEAESADNELEQRRRLGDPVVYVIRPPEMKANCP